MASIRLRYIAPVSAILCLASSVAFAQQPPPAESGAPPPAGDTAAPPADGAAAPPANGAAPPAAEKKGDDGEGDPKTRPSPNSIWAEGLGAGLYYSLNYERRIIDDVGVRVGFSYISYGASVSAGGSSASASVTALTFPIQASYLGLRSGKHTFEVGGGAAITYASGTASSGGVGASSSGIGGFGDILIGYRLHPVGGAGFNFRVGVMALIGPGFGSWAQDQTDPNRDPNAIGVLPWGYISFGASF